MAQQEINLASIGMLLQIEQDVRQASSESAVEFIAVNDTWRLLPYRQAVLWRQEAGGSPAVKLASGLTDLPGDSPFRQWMNQALVHLFDAKLPRNCQLFSIDALPLSLQEGWREWMPQHVLLIGLTTPVGDCIGGLWLTLDNVPGEAERALIERLAGAYGQALWAWRKEVPVWQRWRNRIRTSRKRIWLGLIVIALLPMRLTALAPAEIIGKDARMIAAPLDGVVAQFFVTPNQTVSIGTPLFALDDTGARNRNEVAGKSRAVAEADYLRATQKSFSDGASKADLSSLKAKLEEKTAEAQYTRDLFDRIQVTSPEAGIAVFSDANDWLGKPVQTGERIILLADPNKVQVAIHLSVDDALNLEPGAGVKLYLNVSPLGAVDAVLTQASYEPSLTAEGFVAYHLKADLTSGETPPRIGLKGTAKIYGGWAPLIYHILRKPLAVLRRTVGI
jgi:Biotin-lipoyl like